MRHWQVRTTAAIQTMTLAVFVIAMAGCSSGPVRRISEPAASIQQLSVGADGRWSVDLRLQNFSSVPMRFERVALTLLTGEETAGELRVEPALTIGPESADVTTVSLTPSAAARILIADALADRRSLNYSLEGTVNAAAEDRKPRDYTIKRNSALSPVPGLPGVMR
jgi:hypothetical protein